MSNHGQRPPPTATAVDELSNRRPRMQGHSSRGRLSRTTVEDQLVDGSLVVVADPGRHRHDPRDHGLQQGAGREVVLGRERKWGYFL